MNEQPTTVEETIEQVTCGCPGCLSVPLSILALETQVPLQGWGPMLEELGIRTTIDHIGRQSITSAAARRLLATVRRRDELAAESAQRRTEEMAKKNPRSAPGVPAQEGLSPFESLVAAGGVVGPEQEFGGRPKPRFLEEALVEGARYDAEKRKRAADEKARLADNMKKDLQ